MSKEQPNTAPARAIRKLFQPDAELVGLGVTMAEQVINSRSWERLRPYFADANNGTDEAIRRNGVAVLFGVAICAASALSSLKERGLVEFTGSEPMTREDILYLFKSDQNRFIDALNRITATLARTMEAVPGLKVEKIAAKDASPAPIPVVVVGLPERRTETEIERDAVGDIVSTVQVERDVV